MVYDLTMLIAAMEDIDERLISQVQYQKYIPESLVILIQTYFNNIIYNVFTNTMIVLWPLLVALLRTLKMGHL